MLSKTSYFNATLFRRNLTRFWPLWGLASFIGALFPLAVLLDMEGLGVQLSDAGYNDVLHLQIQFLLGSFFLFFQKCFLCFSGCFPGCLCLLNSAINHRPVKRMLLILFPITVCNIIQKN